MNRSYSPFCVFVAVLALGLLSAFGCGQTRRSTAGGEVVAAASGDTPALREVAAEGLPELRDALPPLDSGRVELAAPLGWRVASRKSGYLTRFYVAKENDLPLLWITVTEASAEEPASITRQNGPEYARSLRDKIVPEKIRVAVAQPKEAPAAPAPADEADETNGESAEAAEGEAPKPVEEKPSAAAASETPSNPPQEIEAANPFKLIEPVEAIVLGDNIWARYVVKGVENGATIERQLLVTTHDGRRYTIELRVAPGTLAEHRDAAYATAAGINFVQGAHEFLEPDSTHQSKLVPVPEEQEPESTSE